MTAADDIGTFWDLERIRTMNPAARVVRMVGNRLDVVVGERIEVLAGLTLVAGAGQDMIQMRDHTGRIEELAVRVEVEAPRIARTLGEDLEDLAGGV